jgi:hypothetical protein
MVCHIETQLQDLTCSVHTMMPVQIQIFYGRAMTFERFFAVKAAKWGGKEIYGAPAPNYLTHSFIRRYTYRLTK